MHGAPFLTCAGALALVLAVGVSSAAVAQSQQEDERQIAQECLEELRSTAGTLAQEGYWITGWGDRWGWGVGQGMGAAPADVPPATGAVPQEGTPGAAAPPGTMADPWGFGAMAGAASPRHQIRTLFSAANVLAYQGDEEGCQFILARLQQTADDHLTQLREMGVPPDQVVDWRREAMAGAISLTALEPRGIFMDNIIGMDVRNPQDELLGSVSDVVLDIEEGVPEFVLVARGGFLGIGEEQVLVPWDALGAAPRLNTLVLDVSEQAFEQAPAVDAEVATQPEWMDRHRQDIEAYWDQQRAG